MTQRDPRVRGRRYDGTVGRRQLFRWVIRGVRLLAFPTAILSLLLAVDVMLPGSVEEGIVYRGSTDARWLGPDRISYEVGWPARSGCVEERDSGRRYLFTVRPGCSGVVHTRVGFGRAVEGGDTLQVRRTPLFGNVREVRHPSSGRRDREGPFWDLGLLVGLGIIPLVSLGDGFAVLSTTGRQPRYHLVYVLPALFAELVYIWLFLSTILGW